MHHCNHCNHCNQCTITTTATNATNALHRSRDECSRPLFTGVPPIFSALPTHRWADGWVGNGLWTRRQPENKGGCAKIHPSSFSFSHVFTLGQEQRGVRSTWCKGCLKMRPDYRLQALDMGWVACKNCPRKSFSDSWPANKLAWNTLQLQATRKHIYNCSLFKATFFNPQICINSILDSKVQKKRPLQYQGGNPYTTPDFMIVIQTDSEAATVWAPG